MKKLPSFILVVLLFVSTLFFVSPNAFAVDNTLQSYVDQYLVGQGLSGGSILGQDGAQLAASSGVNVSDSEAKALITLFKDPKSAFSSIVTVNNTRYIPTRADSEVIYATKGATGVVAVKTPKSIVIGTYNESLRPDTAGSIVGKLGGFLAENDS
ncbi:profilin [Nostoc sp. UHCC 0302]|uniref:profilin n=1 Tax=Nostoc sp. UHCC 0302 TaxID=3134896 RepID=UPI00311C9364